MQYLPELLILPSNQPQKALVSTHYQLGPANLADVVWLEPTEEGSVTIGQVREMIANLQYKPENNKLRWRIVLEAEKLTLPAQHSLLKTLEDTPPETRIILATCAPQQLLPTISSRCIEVVETAAAASALDPELVQIWQELPTYNLKQIFELSQKYSQRVGATEAVETWIQAAHQSHHHPQNYQHQLWLLEALEYLRQNANPRLVLEQTAFKITGII